MCSRFYQRYQWYTNIVQGSTNGTISPPIGTNGKPMVPLATNGTTGKISNGTNGKPMVPLATNGTIGKISNGTIGRTPNARIDCGYSLEPHHSCGSNVYPRSNSFSKRKKNIAIFHQKNHFFQP